MRAAHALVLALWMLAGCGNNDAKPETPAPVPNGIDLQLKIWEPQTFIGPTVDVLPDGTIMSTQPHGFGKPDTRSSRTLSQDDAKEIGDLVSSINWPSLPAEIASVATDSPGVRFRHMLTNRALVPLKTVVIYDEPSTEDPNVKKLREKLQEIAPH
jgi:hypothetical protein